MALTIAPSAIHPVDVWGALPVRVVTATPAAADYTTGGYTLTPGSGIPLGSPIFGVITLGDTGGTGAVVLKWNTSTSKLQAFWSGAVAEGGAAAAELAEVTAGTDLSAFTFTLLIIGINP